MSDGTSGGRAALAVVVVTYNSAAHLPDLLASLAEALDGLAYDLVVSDNASSDDSVDVVRRLCPHARVVENHANLGYSAGINAALRQIDDELPVLILNPDTRVTPGAVAGLLEAAAADPEAGIVAPRLVDDGGLTRRSLQREPSVCRELGTAFGTSRLVGRMPLLSETLTDPADYESARYIDWVSGAGLLVTPRARAAVGDWDESYFLYSEEIDYAHRVRRAGLKVRYEPGAVVVHHEGESGESPALWSLAMINKHRYFAGRHGRVAAWGYFLALLARCLTRMAKPTYRAAALALVGYAIAGPDRSIERVKGPQSTRRRAPG